MGLDHWFEEEVQERREIHRWRKHNALHGWFENLAIEMGLVKDEMEFNCVQVDLTPQILDKLEHAVRNHELGPVDGFSFGDTDYDPTEHEQDDLDAIAKAREVLVKGGKCYYNSWW